MILESMEDRSRWLTLGQVFAGMNLRQNRLTVLNGCESGMLRAEGVDEYIGLPAGFLYAGAACVISTLWAVDDLSSALVMDRFHGEMAGGQAPAAALREACRWLREGITSGPHLREVVMPEFLGRVADAMDQAKCRAAADELARKYPDAPPFASLAHWAPYICSGLGYRLENAGPSPAHMVPVG